MGADTVGDVFDQRRTEIAAGTFRCPAGDRMDREVVIAVDAERRNAETEAAGRKRPGATTGDTLEGRDRPLVVDDVEDNRRLVG